jgi:hypothetical protein
MPACVSGAVFDWPQVVFQTADEAGNAVAVALQDATCTFTVAPQATPALTPAPTPSPAASATATPVGKPAAPGKPSVEALNQALQVAVAPADPVQVSSFHYECSADNGASWTSQADAAPSGNTTAQIRSLTNGTAYVCRAFALNATGRSDASPVSDAVRPCGTALECTPILAPVLGVLGIVLVAGLILALVAVARSRRRGYVIAIVDVVHTANLGYGSKLGIGFVRDPVSRQVTGVVADRSPTADIRIRHLGNGRFAMTDRHGRQVAADGERVLATDSVGARHEVVLRAFNTKAASAESTYR